MPSQFVTNSLASMPLETLIGGPLIACAKAQKQLADVSLSFISTFFSSSIVAPDPNILPAALECTFTYKNSDNEITTFKVPVLAIVHVPSLFIETCDIEFQAEINQSSSVDFAASLNVEYSAFWSPVKVEFNASLTTSSKTSYTAIYTINVHAADKGYSEGLEKIMDALTKSATDSVADAE